MGISTEKLLQLNSWRESPLFSPDEKLVLELAEAMSATPATVSPELRARLRQRFSAAQLIELAAMIAWENYRARANRVFGFESENFFTSTAERAGSANRR